MRPFPRSVQHSHATRLRRSLRLRIIAVLRPGVLRGTGWDGRGRNALTLRWLIRCCGRGLGWLGWLRSKGARRQIAKARRCRDRATRELAEHPVGGCEGRVVSGTRRGILAHVTAGHLVRRGLVDQPAPAVVKHGALGWLAPALELNGERSCWASHGYSDRKGGKESGAPSAANSLIAGPGPLSTPPGPRWRRTERLDVPSHHEI